MAVHEKILLGLDGKRVTMMKRITDDTGEFHWAKVAYADNETRRYVMLDFDEEQYELAKSPYCYYDEEDGLVKLMSVIKGSVDKDSIEADGSDIVTFTLDSNETMTIMVQQESVDVRENILYKAEPVDGLIKVVVNSDCLGSINIVAMGDTQYTEALSVAVV